MLLWKVPGEPTPDMYDDESSLIPTTANPELQTALRWWQSRWSMVATQQAEGIRDGLLQEVFALRRELELSSLATTPPDSNRLQGWIHTLEDLHQQLDNLGDQLSPPYQTDDLALAIQDLLGYWQKKHPVIHVKMGVLSQIKMNNSEFNRVVLFAIEQLLLLIVRIEDVIMIRIELVAKSTDLVLSVIVNRSRSKSPLPESVLAELGCLQEVLPILTCGRLISRPGAQGVSYEFCWANLEPY